MIKLTLHQQTKSSSVINWFFLDDMICYSETSVTLHLTSQLSKNCVSSIGGEN